MKKKKKLNFSPNPEHILNKPSIGVVIENLKRLQETFRWVINFNIDITWAQDKVKVTNLKKLSNIQIWNLKKRD